MPFIKINYQEIYYSFRNHHSFTNLVFIHGAGGSESFWPLNFKKNLTANYYALDLPGHGKSKGEGFQTIQAYADCVEKFIQQLNLDSIVLLGHSMGGAIALSLAIKKPRWLSKLLLISTGARLKVHLTFLEKLQTNFDGAIDWILKTIYGAQTSPLLIEEAKKYLFKIGAKTVLKDFVACNDFDLMNEVGSIDVPTLILVGEKDQVTPTKYSEYLHEKIKKSVFKIIPDGHHMLFLEKSEEIEKELKKFLFL